MSKLIIDDYPLIVLPTLANKIGLNEAIVLQQLHYWVKDSDKVHEGKKWTYNTYEGWLEQFPFWSMSTMRRTLNSLEKQDLIITGNYNKMKADKTKWYTINYEKLGGMNSPSVQNEQSNSSKWTVPSVQNEQSNTLDLPKTNTDIKEQHLDYVYLKPSEYERLLEDFDKRVVDSKIEDLDTYLSNKGKNKFKDHNKTLRNWLKKDGAKKKVKKTKQDEQVDRIRELEDIIRLQRGYYEMTNEGHIYDEAKKELERLEQL